MIPTPFLRTVLACGLAFAAAGASAWQDPSARPVTDPDADRAEYLDREAERAAARNQSDYGRYDRVDRNRARDAAHERMAAHPAGGWLLGSYIHAYNRPLYVVRDYRKRGLDRPPRGSRWMRDDHGDVLLVESASGLISDVVPRD